MSTVNMSDITKKYRNMITKMCFGGKTLMRPRYNNECPRNIGGVVPWPHFPFFFVRLSYQNQLTNRLV